MDADRVADLVRKSHLFLLFWKDKLVEHFAFGFCDPLFVFERRKGVNTDGNYLK